MNKPYYVGPCQTNDNERLVGWYVRTERAWDSAPVLVRFNTEDEANEFAEDGE